VICNRKFLKKVKIPIRDRSYKDVGWFLAFEEKKENLCIAKVFE